MGRKGNSFTNSVFTIQGKDTVDFDFSDADYKIVTYVDSTGCLSCKLQLTEWKEFIQATDSLNIAYIFYFNTSNKEGLKYIMKRDNFIHPVCLDVDDKFNQQNHFPSETNFHTFLLSRNNKVIAIGNPIQSPQIKDIYLAICKGENIAHNMMLTTASLDTNFVEFVKQEKRVILKNTGKNPLVIYGIDASCGCIKIKYNKKPILPGENTPIILTYKQEKNEYFKKTISIYCNIATSPLNIIATKAHRKNKSIINH